MKLLPKLVLTTNDDEWLLVMILLLLVKAEEVIGVYVAVGSNILENPKFRAKVLLFP